MFRVAVFLAGVVALSCGKTSAPTPTETGDRPREADPPRPKVEPEAGPKDSPEVAKFKEGVAHYLAEARAGAKFLTVAPSGAEAEKKAEHIFELYTHLPDPPAGFDKTGKLAERLKDIGRSFAIARQSIEQARHLAGNKEIADVVKSLYDKDLPAMAANVRKYADEVEGIVWPKK